MKKKVLVLFALCLIGFSGAFYGYEDYTQNVPKSGNLKDEHPVWWLVFDGMDDFNKSFNKIARKYKFPMRIGNTDWRKNFVDGKYTYPAPKYVRSGENEGEETDVFQYCKKHDFVLFISKLNEEAYTVCAYYLKNDGLFLTATLIEVSRQSIDAWFDIFDSPYYCKHKADDPILVALDKEFSAKFTDAGSLTEKEEARMRRERDAFLQESYARGKALYEKDIVPLKAKMMSAPFSINSCKTKVNSAGGVDVEIEFENMSDKVCKYVEFDITPYNEVGDIDTDRFGVSRKTIKRVGFVQPRQTLKVSTPEPIWYSWSFSYLKINAVRITYSDNSVVTASNAQNVLETKENRVKTVVLAEGKDFNLTLNYDFYTDSVYMELPKDFSYTDWGMATSYSIIGSAERQLVGDKFVDALQAVEQHDRDKNRFILSAQWASAKSISLVYRAFLSDAKRQEVASSKEVLYEFSEDDIRRVRDFACIYYYRNGEK